MRRVAVALVGISLVLSGLPASALAQTDPEPEPLGDFVVDDDGLATIDDCDGLGVVPTQIQDAVDTASSGDTIFVCSGLYREQVDVPYPLTLLGAQAGKDPSRFLGRLEGYGVSEEAIIDGGAVDRHGIRVEFKDADGTNGDPTVGPVVIDGFTIQDATASGIELRSGNGNRVANNVITGNEQGLYFIGFGEAGTLIEDNIFLDNNAAQNGTGNGIFGGGGGPDRSDNTVIRSNEFSGHSNAGIVFSPPAASNVRIIDNDSVGDGVFAAVWRSSSLLIARNEVFEPEGGGIYLGGGNSDVDVRNNVVDTSDAGSCGSAATAAVELDKYSDEFPENSGTLQISNNDLEGHDFGVRVNADSVATSVEISRNSIEGNYCDGISLLDGTENRIRLNQINDNARGMTIETPDAVIDSNSFSDNSSRHEPGEPDHIDGTGIFGRNGFDGLRISENSFTGHAQSAITLIGENVSDPSQMTSGITVRSNESSADEAPDDSFLALFRVADATVVDNSAEGTSGSSIYLGGGNDGIAIKRNSIAGAAGGAITISEFEFTGSNQAFCPSRNVTVSENHLLTSAAGLQILSSSGDDEPEDAVAAGCLIPALEDRAQDAYTGALSASYNRIVGNTVGVLNTDDDTIVDARNNWWGCNEGPADATCDDVGSVGAIPVQFDPWLVLEVSSDKSTLGPDETASFTADLTDNSDGEDSGGHVPDGTPVVFSVGLGSITPSTDVFEDGLATATITNPAPGVAGTTFAQATVDNETQETPLTFTAPSPSPAQTTTTSPTPTVAPTEDDDDGGSGGGGSSGGGGGGGGSGSRGDSDSGSGSGGESDGSATPSPTPETTTSPTPESSPSPTPEDDTVLGKRFVKTRVTIGLAGERFRGQVRARVRRCKRVRTVVLKRTRGGRVVDRFQVVSRRGRWQVLLDRVSPGRWFAVVKVKRFTSRSGRLVTCGRDRSRTILRRVR